MHEAGRFVIVSARLVVKAGHRFVVFLDLAAGNEKLARALISATASWNSPISACTSHTAISTSSHF
jgi:hypothetical protein